MKLGNLKIGKKNQNMQRVSYSFMAFLGALVGINIAIPLFDLSNMSYVASNHLPEAISLLLVGSLLLTFLPRLNALYLPIITYIAGFAWEAMTFSSLFVLNELTYVLKNWAVYGAISLTFIGFPVLLLARHVRKEKKIWGIKTTNSSGLIFMFLISLITTIVIIFALVQMNVFTMANGLTAECCV
jgi:hypothetical protein